METTRAGNSRDRVKEGEGERERERRTVCSRDGGGAGLNLISEKRVDTATAGSDRVIRTTLSPCYVLRIVRA